jgi:glucokinase
MQVKQVSNPIGRPSMLRHTNALTILKLLREVGSCSRADLVRASGLSAPTVTNVVGDLLIADLIKPLGEGESSGGRPPDMISFKAERGCLLAVQISIESVEFLLTDLRGAEVDRAKVPLSDRDTTPPAICLLIRDEARRLLKKNRKSRGQMLVLSVAVPAITNVDDGIVVSISPFREWRSVPLRLLLSKYFDCVITIENDTNLAALGEHYRGASQPEQTFALISIGANVSAGIVLNGHIHHGTQWSAGEIAYLRLPNVSRKHPALHEFGELESVLTCAGIVRDWQKLAPHSTPRGKAQSQIPSALDILNLAQAEERHAREVIQVRAAMVADIVVNLSLILNPALILLGGVVGCHPILLHLVQRELQQADFGVATIAVAVLGDAAPLWGGIALALEEIPSILLPQLGR